MLILSDILLTNLTSNSVLIGSLDITYTVGKNNIGTQNEK